ncbi:MAG TPA: methyltransferase domain-containing protein [Chloroflexia bacterium]|nr:methyltransferase domain-containing protein [Chloroflexia bacterium]
MISKRLLDTVTCPAPECVPLGVRLEERNDMLVCSNCGRSYPPAQDGYLDLMPPAEREHTSLYVSHSDEFEATLDYRRIGPPVLGAGVRQRAIRRMLKPGPHDSLVELGCGNGKFLVWNRRRVDWAVGVDPAPLFADEALRSIDLVRADARALPFPAATFTAAMSIDVLEHLPLPDFKAYLGEAHRVLAPGGRMLIYSNTREGSRLDFVVRGARLLSRKLASVGLIDDTRDRLRKSDHVKAVETYPQLVEVLGECGFRVERVVFWNGLFQSIIENLLVKLVESALRMRRGQAARAHTGAASAGGEDRLRSSMRGAMRRGGPAWIAARLLTELMWLDLALFGRWRAGPYFVLVRREGGR